MRDEMPTLNGGPGRRILLLAILMGGLWLAGCGLFDIRDPDPPVVEGSACPHHSPSAVDSVVFNFEAALACKGAGLSNLNQALGDPFVFVLDLIDIGSPATRPDSMNKTTTSNAFDTFFQNTVKQDSVVARINYQALPPADNQVQPDGRHLFRRVGYQVLIFAPATTTPKTTISGVADIYFRSTGGLWKFDHWQDRPASDTPSLGAVLGDAVGR